ncbi:MAG: stage III sporulation protein AG [Lachnospiraceae bacterium]|nr:stage III sporulation protein AG [Lachnospiraceae bacterium]
MLSYRWETIRKKVGIRNLALLLVAGVLLLVSSFASSDTTKQPEEKQQTTGQGSLNEQPVALLPEQDVATALEQRLCEVLEKVKGVGKVQVMLTLADEGERVVLKDTATSAESLNENDGSGGSRVDILSEKEEVTVYEDGSVPYVTKEISAKVAGVLVVCEGGGNPEVVVQIVSATEALFQVSAHRIVVLEMK